MENIDCIPLHTVRWLERAADHHLPFWRISTAELARSSGETENFGAVFRVILQKEYQEFFQVKCGPSSCRPLVQKMFCEAGYLLMPLHCHLHVLSVSVLIVDKPKIFPL